jgi:type IV pilus biogenesis protein CpaD/CtpE
MPVSIPLHTSLIRRPLRAIVLPIGLITALASLGGCDNRDPYSRTDVWQPTGANAGNIAAQAANPLDLIHGRGATSVDAHAATAPVERVWSGSPRPLAPIGTSGGS